MTCSKCQTNPVRPPWAQCWDCFSGKPAEAIPVPAVARVVRPPRVSRRGGSKPRPCPSGRTPCRHCGFGAVNRPRGLCWTCYYTPGLKEGYASESVYACRGCGYAGRGLGIPTDAMPGTVEKVAVLAARAAAGLRLWHPDDAGTRRNRRRRAA